jgi:hypothetical protein
MIFSVPSCGSSGAYSNSENKALPFNSMAIRNVFFIAFILGRKKKSLAP